MRIYIDESGTFIRAKNGPSISVVGALVLPDYRWPRIQRLYAKLRPGLPQENGEVKGRLLDEQHIDSVVSLLRSNDALLVVAAIDLDLQPPQDILTHQNNQARAITASLTPRHHPNLQAGVKELRRQLESMAPQLYVQSVLMFELIHHVYRVATLYFSQRQPKELAAFHWRIDAKDKGKITDWEKWWTGVVFPFLQDKFLQEPTPLLEEGDYSFMKRFETELPAWVPRPSIPKDRQAPAMNLKLILMEDFRFASDPDPGLELVDIMVNAVRRSLIGNLQASGFSRISSLMTSERGQSLRLISMAQQKQKRAKAQYDAIIKKYYAEGGRSILLPRG